MKVLDKKNSKNISNNHKSKITERCEGITYLWHNTT